MPYKAFISWSLFKEQLKGYIIIMQTDWCETMGHSIIRTCLSKDHLKLNNFCTIRQQQYRELDHIIQLLQILLF